jgi:hypothetical protein
MPRTYSNIAKIRGTRSGYRASRSEQVRLPQCSMLRRNWTQTRSLCRRCCNEVLSVLLRCCVGPAKVR